MATILVDMDGTIADWGKKWDDILDRHYPMSAVPRHAEQRSFDLRAGLNESDLEVVDAVMNWPNFYRDLEPFPGAVEALREMVEVGHTVFLVTSPTVTNHTCSQDKLEWAEDHIGVGWSKRVIITHDKTIISGDVLIDDKPDITGDVKPSWVQIVFNQPYNVQSQLTRMLKWDEWRVIVDAALWSKNFSKTDSAVDQLRHPGSGSATGLTWPDVMSYNVYTEPNKPREVHFEMPSTRIAEGGLANFADDSNYESITPRIGQGGVIPAGRFARDYGDDQPETFIPLVADRMSGEIRDVSATGGAKGVKPERIDLVPVHPLLALARLYARGAEKYDNHNWRKGYAWSNSYAALMRHAMAFWNGEDIDPELQEPHMAAVAFHAFALLQFMRDYPEYDDRYKGEN